MQRALYDLAVVASRRGIVSAQATWDRPDTCLRARLHHLGLRSADPAALADFYEMTMGFRCQSKGSGVIARGPGRILVIEQGAARTLAYAAYAVADVGELKRLERRIEQAGHSSRAHESSLFTTALAVDDPDGNKIVVGVPLGAEPSESEAMTARLQHIVMASTDAQAIAAFYEDVLGFTVSDTVLDDEGQARTIFLRCSHEHHSFAVFQASECRFDHHCYELSDWNAVRDWGDHFAALHVPLQWGPGRHGPGNNLFFFIHDLDGNWVELSAELEIVAHDRPAGTWAHEERTLNSWGKGLLRS